MYNAIIVEDDPVIAKLNSLYLEKYKDITLMASFRNGFDAISFIEKNHTDLILLDYHLPGIDGCELLARIRKMNFRTEVIVITMDNDTDAIREFMSYGIIDFILKPYSHERFNRAIATFLIRASSIKQSSYISQAEIDKYFSYPSLQKKTANQHHEKGIRNETRDKLIHYLKSRSGIPLTLNEILNDIPLSRVTLRRYMNHFTEEGTVYVNANYSTGGRPSMIYTYNSDTSQEPL
ncbi:MAG: response regulator [Lachnospiraceae bacterium]